MKKWFSFFVAIVATVLFFSSTGCGYNLDPAPISVMYTDTTYAFYPVPQLESINLCAGGQSKYEKVVGWGMATDTVINRGIVTITVDKDGNLISSSAMPVPTLDDQSSTPISQADKSEPGSTKKITSHRERNPLWPWIWPIIIALLAGLLIFVILRALFDAMRFNSMERRVEEDENRRREENHQQNIRNQEWARMREAMGLNRQTDGDFLNRMNAGGMKFSISNEEKNPPVSPADGGGPGSDG